MPNKYSPKQFNPALHKKPYRLSEQPFPRRLALVAVCAFVAGSYLLVAWLENGGL